MKTPRQLWHEAGGDRARYELLMIDEGHIVKVNASVYAEVVRERDGIRAQLDAAKAEVERLQKKNDLLSTLAVQDSGARNQIRQVRDDEIDRLRAQLDARIAWQVQAVAHMQTWRALFDAAVAMREGHEGCVTEPKCGSCFRCDFDRAVDEAMTAVAAGSEKFIEDSTLAGQLAAWLDSKARYFIHNRNLGPYSAELAKQIRDGSWREDNEVLPPFGPGAECSLCHQDHSQSDEEQG